jgi:hypothetical protein
MRGDELRQDALGHKSRFAVLSSGIFLWPWWTRTWTLQEVLLARQAVFLVGDYIIKWSGMRSWISWLLSENDIINRTTSNAFITLCWHFAAKYGTDARQRQWPEWVLGVLCARSLADSKEKLAVGHQNVQTLLVMTATRGASDPRDKVFALLGIMSEEERAKIRIDYRRSKMEVYHQVTRSLWPTWYYFTSILFFPFVSVDSGSNEPSWVSDFSANWHGPAPLMHYITADTDWLGAQQKAYLSPDGHVLGMWATRLCEVWFEQGISKSPAQDPESFASNVQRIISELSAARSMTCAVDSPLRALEPLRTKELPIQIMALGDKAVQHIREVPALSAMASQLDSILDPLNSSVETK